MADLPTKYAAAREAFKNGVVDYCAQHDISPREAGEMLKFASVKGRLFATIARHFPRLAARMSSFKPPKLPAWASRAGWFTGGVTGGAGLTTALGLARGAVAAGAQMAPYVPAIGAASGLIAGGGLGYAQGKLQEKEVDPEDIKAKELAKIYEEQARRLSATKNYKNYLKSKAAL